MKFSHLRQAALVAACLVRMLTEFGSAQVPAVGIHTNNALMPEIGQWQNIRSHHSAQQIEQAALAVDATLYDDAAFSHAVLEDAFHSQEYEAAYHQATTLLFKYPNDPRRPDVLYIQGASAFQTGRIDTALSSLTAFVTEYPAHPQRGIAYYWRARCKLEKKDWFSAESDFKQCAEDSASHSHHDDAMLGWALALERRGEYTSAMNAIQNFINSYPQSDILNDAKIRLAALKLRLGDARGALIVIQDTKTPYRYQREESLLLRAEANFQMGFFDSARVRYERFIKDFPESNYIKNARYGLAWANLKLGNLTASREELDRLGNGTDTLAMTAQYQNAVISLLNNDTKDATARFESLVQTFPYEQFSDNAYVQLGLNSYRAQRYRDARKYFQLAARLYPESELKFTSYRMMGEACLALSDFSNAQYAFSQVRKSNAPDSILAPALFQEGVSLYHLGRFKSSAERFDDYLQKYSGTKQAAVAYVWKGEALYQDYRFDEAERAFAEALRQYPNNPKKEAAQYGIAWSYFEQKNFRKAIEEFNQFIKLFPQSEHKLDAALRKADSYYFIGEYAKSEDLYASLAAEKKDGRYTEYAAFQIAMSYIQRGDAERGIERLRNFLSRYKSSIYCEVVQFNIAWTYFSKEQFSDALNEFHLFLKNYPESQLLPRVYFNTGDAFYNTKLYDSARVYYTKVLQEFPQSPLSADALSGLEFTYKAEGRSLDALKAIEQYTSTIPTGASQEDLLLRKADIFFDQGDFSSAIQEYQHVLSMKPSRDQQAKATEKIGRAYELENNPAQAVAYYKQIVDNFADMDAAPSVALTLGNAYTRLKQHTQARDVFKSFEQKFPSSPLLPEARYLTAIAFLNLNDSSSALTQFLAVVAKHPTELFGERSRLQIATYFQMKKQYKTALDTLEGIIQRRNDDLAAEALLIMGNTYLMMKHNGDALQAFLDVIEQYKEYSLLVERAKLGAGDAYTKLYEKSKAKKMYQEIINSPVDPEAKKEAQERLRRLR